MLVDHKHSFLWRTPGGWLDLIFDGERVSWRALVAADFWFGKCWLLGLRKSLRKMGLASAVNRFLVRFVLKFDLLFKVNRSQQLRIVA